jgi:RepB DNA-primase N-terminal domain
MITLAREAAMSQIAASFLRRCFAPEDTIAILLRRQDAAAPMQRVVRMEQALETRYMAWLSYENQRGRNNIYVAANPLLPGSRRRTKESIASVHHLYIDIDTDGDARLAALRASELVPPPTSVLSTSPGKYQVLWRVEGFDFAGQEQTLKLLAIAFGGDPACTDCNRVLRIPGFLNRKYDPPYKVSVEYPDDSIWTSDDFQLDAGAVDAMLPGNTSGSRKQPSKHSHSESDWAWILHELAHGKDAVSLTHELASRRSDKPNPLYYAQRTIDIASARLWFVEGTSLNDIIAMLKARRCRELPAALCSTRAREIAATAQRMIAHRKSA